VTQVKQADSIASLKEVSAALAKLNSADMVRLAQFARLRAMGISSADWEDLLHEAIQRALSGSRKWPKKITILAFLLGTIRSVASEFRRKKPAWRHRTCSQRLAK